MRMLITVRMPNERFNAAVRDGTVGSKIRSILETTKPESVYFTEQCGQRCATIIADLPTTSAIPALAEPWFLAFDAEVQFHPAMTLEDLGKAGLEQLGKQWR